MQSLRFPPDPSPLSEPGLATAPLAAVLVALISLWVLAIPAPLHAVALNLRADCAVGEAREPTALTVRISADNTVSLDGHRLDDRTALDARLQALTSRQDGRRLALLIAPHPEADYSTAMAVLAAAQRHNVVHLQVQAHGHLLPRASCPPLMD